MKAGVIITGPESAHVLDCEFVLRALPQYFGIEEAIVQYLEDIVSRPTFHAWQKDKLIGFLSVTHHNQCSAEIHVMAVAPEFHHQGIGTALIQSVEQYLIKENVKLLEVKTLGETHPDENYKRTRSFYVSRGFFPLEEISDFWGKGLPTLFMVKPLFDV